MASNASAEGVVTLKMINELQQQVLDNNPIYKYLLSDVSFPLPPSPLYYLDARSAPTNAHPSSEPPSLVPFLGPLPWSPSLVPFLGPLPWPPYS